jgi:hypothetical protein
MTVVVRVQVMAYMLLLGNRAVEARHAFADSSLDSRVFTVLIIWVLVLAELLKVWERDVSVCMVISLQPCGENGGAHTLLPVLSDVTVTLTPPHRRPLVRVAWARVVATGPGL